MFQYQVRNWSQYNESLKKRGSLSLWISEDAINKWQPPKDPNFIGAPQQYSDDAILCMMALKVVYNIPYRQLIGFVFSIFALMKVVLKVPHFTTVAARAKLLGKHFKKLSKSSPADLVFDSSGFKIYGEGEWKVRQHGKQKRRRWKKFHIGVCPQTHEIIVAEVTELEAADCEVGPRLIKNAPKSVKRAIGDDTIHYQYTYDKKDRPILIKDLIHETNTARIYDQYDNLKSETLDNGLTLTYTYDLIDRPLSVTLPDQSSIRYRYNAYHLLAIERIKEKKMAFSHHYLHYDLAGNVIEETLLGQAGAIHYQYDLLHRPICIKAPHWQESILQNGFDAVGNLLKREVIDEKGLLTYTYDYDSLNQLISEDGFVSHTYQNDSVYNRTAKDNQPYEVNILNQLKSQTSYSYHYDENGNLKKKISDSNKIKYIYDALDRLIEVQKGPEITTYTYDSFHRRLSKKHNDTTTYYIYHNQNELGAVLDGKITQFRVLGLSQGAEIGGAVALELDDKTYVPIHDPQGNIVVLTYPSGQLIENYRYTAFGEMKAFSHANVDNPWRYSSKRYDPETGFIYFGRRYYDPSIGRWITPDPAGYADGPNLYAYVHNKPLIYIDPDGRFGLGNGLLFSPYQSNSFAQGAMMHGVCDFAMSNVHALEQGAMYIGCEDLDYDAKVCMFDNLRQQQSERMDALGGFIMDAQGISHDDSHYNSIRHGTTTSLEVASLAVAGYSLGRGIYNLTRGGVCASSFTSNLTNLGKTAKSSIGNDAKLNAMFASNRSIQFENQRTAFQIAQGHAFEKHVLTQGEFSGWIRTRKQFAEHIENVLNNPSHIKQLRNNRTAYWHQETGTVIIRNSNAIDGGTAFQPKDGFIYYNEILR